MSANKFGEQIPFIEACDDKDLPSDPIIRDAFTRIWDKLKSEIFLWNSFKTDLPFEINNQSSNEAEKIDLHEQHQQDLRAMCFDEQGKRKRLDKGQLTQIKKTGRFTVKSQMSESFDNVWLLGSLLQQGSENIVAKFKQRKKNALRHWFLYLPEYFSSSGPLTISGALKDIKNGFFHLFRIIFGSSEYRPRYSEGQISTLVNKARINYLVEDLDPDSEKIYNWTLSQHRKLNLLFADQSIISQVKALTEELKEKLTEQGDNTDESLLTALIEHHTISDIDPELPELIKGFHYFSLQLSSLNPEYDKYYQAEVERIDQQLIKDYPFRGRYKSWRDKQLLLKEHDIHQLVNKQLAADLLSSLKEGQEAYLLKRNMDFDDELSDGISNRLSLKMRLSKIFRLPVIQWSFRSLTNKESLPVVKIKLTTKSCCWRVAYFFTFTRMLLHNTVLKLFRALLHNPYGIKSIATLSKEKFNGEIWLLDNGKPYKAKKYGTYLTDIDDTGRLIKKYRLQFEEKSDYGLFPRSIGRIFNLFFCYVVIGIVGVVFNLSFRVLAFCVVSMVTTLGAFLAPLWVPAFTLLVFLFNLFIYDYIGPSPYYTGRKQKPYSAVMPVINTLINHMLIRGFLVTLIGLLGVTFHVIIVPLIYILSFLAYVLSYVWDVLMRIIFIYPFARIPGDDFAGLITRIAGHGIASNVLNTVNKEDALQKYEIWMQMFVLDIYESVLLKHLNSSDKLLSKMMDGPYRAIVGDKFYVLEDALRNNIQDYESDINNTFYRFRDSIYAMQNTYRAELMRLSRVDLENFLSDSKIICQRSIEHNLMPWLSEAEAKMFWLNLGINENDWLLLNRVLLSQSFSADIFTPIEECDDNISVEVENINFAKSLLTEKQPVSKLNFIVNQLALTPQTEKKLLFIDNNFWDVLYEPLYLPVRWYGECEFLLRLRARRLEYQ